MLKEVQENSPGNASDVLRIIPDWKFFFREHADTLFTQTAVFAHGGTIDAVSNISGRLEPVYHPVNILRTENLSAIEITNMFLGRIRK